MLYLLYLEEAALSTEREWTRKTLLVWQKEKGCIDLKKKKKMMII